MLYLVIKEVVYRVGADECTVSGGGLEAGMGHRAAVAACAATSPPNSHIP